MNISKSNRNCDVKGKTFNFLSKFLLKTIPTSFHNSNSFFCVLKIVELWDEISQNIIP